MGYTCPDCPRWDEPIRRPAREITAGTIEQALRTMATRGGQRKRALSHRSLGYALGSLRQAFAYAERERWLTSNPATVARVPSTQRRTSTEERVKRWAPAQLGQFRGQLEHYADGRPSIALGLQAAGVPDYEAAALLGHDVATFRRFYLVTDDDGAAGAARSARGLLAVM